MTKASCGERRCTSRSSAGRRSRIAATPTSDAVDHAELVGELEQLVAEAPLRERLHGFLMLALYRAGRQAEALRAFQAAREILGEELGLDPGPELQALEAAILRQDPALLLPVRPSTAGPEPPDEPHGGPQPVHRARGRPRGAGTPGGRPPPGDDRRAGRRREDPPGPGAGAGRRLEHDAFFVELAPVGDPAALPDAVAAGIGLPEAGLLQRDASAALERLVEHLADRPDDRRHGQLRARHRRVGSGGRAPAGALPAAAHPRHEPRGPRPRRRDDLAGTSAGRSTMPIELFTDRADAAGAARRLARRRAAVVEDVCTRLDGLPLAIELAAARVRVIPVQQLADRLDDRFRLLTGGARTALPRQQTLRAVVEWSYDLLFDDERRVFELLSVFAGGCSLEAAEAVCAGDQIEAEDVADLLAHLVDKSLLVADHTGGEARFHLLQTLALFGRERLAASKVASDARDRHAAHYRALAERGPGGVPGRRPGGLAGGDRSGERQPPRGPRMARRAGGRRRRASPRRRDGLVVVAGRKRGGGAALVRRRPRQQGAGRAPEPGPGARVGRRGGGQHGRGRRPGDRSWRGGGGPPSRGRAGRSVVVGGCVHRSSAATTCDRPITSGRWRASTRPSCSTPIDRTDGARRWRPPPRAERPASGVIWRRPPSTTSRRWSTSRRSARSGRCPASAPTSRS